MKLTTDEKVLIQERREKAANAAAELKACRVIVMVLEMA